MNKDNIEIKNLSEEEGSVQNAIVNWWQTYDFFEKSSEQIYNDLIQIIPKEKKEDSQVKRLLGSILRSKDYTIAASIIQEFVLRGDNLSNLRGFKEVEPKFMKNFGRKR